jgi:hypothetical protein
MTTTKQRKTTERKANLSTMTDGSLLLGLTVGDATTLYLVRPLPSDFGAAFQLTKAWNGTTGGEQYDVLLHGRESSCTCKGNTYRGKCKHVEALTKLQQLGKL